MMNIETTYYLGIIITAIMAFVIFKIFVEDKGTKKNKKRK